MKHARWPPLLCAGLHVLAMAALVFWLQGGLTGSGAHEYTTRHATVWRLGWAVWMASAISLVLFYNWWCARLPEAGGWPVVIAGVGVVFDLWGETMLMSHASGSVDPLGSATAMLLTAGAANGLYTLAGILLMLSTRGLPGWVRALMWTTWIAGIAMTVLALADSVDGIVVASAVLFPVFVVWVTWMGLKWRPGE